MCVFVTSRVEQQMDLRRDGLRHQHLDVVAAG